MSYKPGEFDQMALDLTDNDVVVVEYDSRHSDDLQRLEAKVRMAGYTWNESAFKVELDVDGDTYRLTVPEDGSSATLYRIQYDWQNGKRTGVQNRRVVSQDSGITQVHA